MRLLLIALLAACGASPPAVTAPHTQLACDATFETQTHWFADRDDRADAARTFLSRCGERELIATTSALVQCQTVAAMGDESELACLLGALRTFADAHGLEVAVSGEADAYEVVLPGRDRTRRALMFVGHGDVVPVGDPPSVIAIDSVPEGWTVPAFTTTERDGRLYGRGTEDDKGPIAASLVVLGTMRAAGLELVGDVVVAIGNDEEHDWTAFERYASESRAERVVSTDAAFPVVIAQSGFVAWGLHVPSGERARDGARIVAAESGLFLTQIPDVARVTIAPGRGETPDALLARVREAAQAELAGFGAGWSFEVEPREGGVELIVHGVSVHSSEPESGRNAIWPLGPIAARLQLEPGPVAQLLDVVADFFAGDHHGQRAGLAYEDALMGPLLVAPTKLRMDEAGATLSINMRRPRGRSAEEFAVMLDAFLGRLREEHPSITAIEDAYIGEPHVAPSDSELVRTLLDIYRAHTGQADAQPIAERGGTYARLFPGAVDFGPSLPGHTYRGHGADEYIEIDTLKLCARMYLDVALRLAR